MVVLLGPQRFQPTLASAVRSLGIEGDIATVTAGWQERESEDAELRDHLGARTVNLFLHKRAEDVFDNDRQLAAAHGLRQERLRQLQAVYRVRLAQAKQAAMDVMRTEGDQWLLEPERVDAIEAMRALDAHHLGRVSDVQATFEETVRPHSRAAIARHRTELAGILEKCAALAIAGGHVAVLLNRLSLFGILELAASHPVFAWSAGAMVVSDRIVLFHDNPPQGAGAAEVFVPGLGLVPSLVALPHARTRLHLEDVPRVALLARRFAPARCAVLDAGSRLDWDGRRLSPVSAARMLAPTGQVEEVTAA